MVAIAATFGFAQSPTVYRAGDPGLSLPVSIDQFPPTYTADAMVAGVQGSVKLECVVNADGTIGDVRVVKPLFSSLDEQSVKSLKKWRFRPGTKGGQPVAVLVEVEHAFSLGDGRRRSTGRVYGSGQQGVTAPRVYHEVKAVYPPSREATRTAPESVLVDVVVRPDGTVVNAKLRQTVEPDVGAAALEAARQWLFDPGWKDGAPVATRITVWVGFRMP